MLPADKLGSEEENIRWVVMATRNIAHPKSHQAR